MAKGNYMYKPTPDSFFYNKNIQAPHLLKIKKKINDLNTSTPENIIDQIQAFLDFFQSNKTNFNFYDDELTPYWEDLIIKHSNFLSSMRLALGGQIPLSQLKPFEQLLGIYYLTLALKSDQNPSKNQIPYSDETLKFLHLAAEYSSIQGMLLLRAHYYYALTTATNRIDIDSLKKTSFKLMEKYKTPGLILYGEMLLHMCQYLIKTKSNTNYQDDITHKIYNLFHEGVQNCYLGHFLQPISCNEINNAYGVQNGLLPYSSPGIFYDGNFASMDSFCRKMREKMNLGLDLQKIKREAQTMANILLAPGDCNSDKGLEQNLSILY